MRARREGSADVLITDWRAPEIIEGKCSQTCGGHICLHELRTDASACRCRLPPWPLGGEIIQLCFRAAACWRSIATGGFRALDDEPSAGPLGEVPGPLLLGPVRHSTHAGHYEGAQE